MPRRRVAGRDDLTPANAISGPVQKIMALARNEAYFDASKPSIVYR